MREEIRDEGTWVEGKYLNRDCSYEFAWDIFFKLRLVNGRVLA